MFTLKGPVVGSFQPHAVTTRKSIRCRHIGKPCICVRLLCFSSGVLHHTSLIAAKIVSLKFVSNSNISVGTLGSLEQKHQHRSGQCKMQIFRSGTKFRLDTKCRLQTGCKMQTEDLYLFCLKSVDTLARLRVRPLCIPTCT